MSATKTFATTIHDAIDEVTTTVEGVHKSIADLPLEALGNISISPLEKTLDEIRAAQARSIGAVYELIRNVNGRVRRLTTGSRAR
jgi:hypothetical protein